MSMLNYDKLKLDNIIRILEVRYILSENCDQEASHSVEFDVITIDGRIRIVFLQVRKMVWAGLSQFGYQFGEPLVDDVKSLGLEGINYRLTDEIEGWCIESAEIAVINLI